MADYLPEVAELDRRIFPTPETLTRWLDGEVDVQEVPIHRDTPDWSLGSFWAHPERTRRPGTQLDLRLPKHVPGGRQPRRSGGRARPARRELGRAAQWSSRALRV